MDVGLRVDVDTLRGTRRGVPALVRLLARHRAGATFFLSVGPDNMGRHLWRLARPAFLAKMLRTRAGTLYGWDVLLRGTVLPGPPIGRRAAPAIRELAASGQEVGFHAWDHHGWQTRIGRMDAAEVGRQLDRGLAEVERLTGAVPACSAAPAWRTTETALREQARRPFAFQSDCRGDEPFVPVLADGSETHLQVPSTLPTYDERVGRGVDAEGFFAELLDRLATASFAVVTVHAEVEGIAALEPFERFLARARGAGHRFVPLGRLAAASAGAPRRRLARREVAGREGWSSCAGEAVAAGAGTAASTAPGSGA